MGCQAIQDLTISSPGTFQADLVLVTQQRGCCCECRLSISWGLFRNSFSGFGVHIWISADAALFAPMLIRPVSETPTPTVLEEKIFKVHLHCSTFHFPLDAQDLGRLTPFIGIAVHTSHSLYTTPIYTVVPSHLYGSIFGKVLGLKSLESSLVRRQSQRYLGVDNSSRVACTHERVPSSIEYVWYLSVAPRFGLKYRAFPATEEHKLNKQPGATLEGYAAKARVFKGMPFGPGVWGWGACNIWSRIPFDSSAVLESKCLPLASSSSPIEPICS